MTDGKLSRSGGSARLRAPQLDLRQPLLPSGDGGFPASFWSSPAAGKSFRFALRMMEHHGEILVPQSRMSSLAKALPGCPATHSLGNHFRQTEFRD